MNLIFLGPPGSGKGTQSLIISNKIQIPRISIGDILRKEIEFGTKVGLVFKSYVDGGILVPDSLIIEIIRRRFSSKDCRNGFILDGFPRNVNQANALDIILTDFNTKLDAVIELFASEDEILERILNRFSCKNCGAVYSKNLLNSNNSHCVYCKSNIFEVRSDDNQKTFLDRIKTYKEVEGSLVDFYKKKDLLFSVNALDSIERVSYNIMKVIQTSLKININ
jgi:adenylate kinase